MSELPIFQQYSQPEKGLVPFAQTIDQLIGDPNYVMWQPRWDKFKSDLSVYWQSVLASLGRFDREQAFNSIVSACFDISAEDFEASSEYSIPLDSLSADRRIINSNECYEWWLANSEVVGLDRATATRIGELNEYQLRFFQLIAASGYVDELVEETPILNLFRNVASAERNPDWLKHGLRGLYLSIYPPSRERQLQPRNDLPSVFVADLSLADQGSLLDSIRRDGSKYINNPSSERARQLTGHLSKIMHKLIVTTAESSSLNPMPTSLAIYANAAAEMEGVTPEVISNEFTKPEGYFRSLVEDMAGHIADWYIIRNLDELHNSIPFNSDQIANRKVLFESYFDSVGAASKEMMDYVAELTGLDLLTIVETILIESGQLTQLNLDWNQDTAESLAKLGELKREISSWLLANRNQNVTSLSLCFVTLARLINSNPISKLRGVVIPSQPVPTENGGHKFIDAAVLSSLVPLRGSELWRYLAEAGESVEVVEVKARSGIVPPHKVTKADMQQVSDYVEDLTAQGVRVEKVHFAYLAPAGNRVISLDVEEVRKTKRLA